MRDKHRNTSFEVKTILAKFCSKKLLEILLEWEVNQFSASSLTVRDE